MSGDTKPEPKQSPAGFEVKVIDRDGAEHVATSQHELDRFMNNGARLAEPATFADRYNRARARLLGRTRYAGIGKARRQEATPHPFRMFVDENGTPFRRRRQPSERPAEPKPARATRAQRLAQFRADNPGASKGEFRAFERARRG